MHLAYSAISTLNTSSYPPTGMRQEQPIHEILLRYQAYQTACIKYSHEIAAIQKYMPEWMPKPPTP